MSYGNTEYQRKNALQDAAIIELLFSTEIRDSELCNLSNDDVDLHEGTIPIHRKGNKERRIQIADDDIIYILCRYKAS